MQRHNSASKGHAIVMVVEILSDETDAMPTDLFRSGLRVNAALYQDVFKRVAIESVHNGGRYGIQQYADHHIRLIK